MNPALIGTAARGVLGAGQLIYGLLNKPGDRPKMTTPGAVKEATARNRNLATASTDAIKQGQERDVNQGVSSAVSNVKRSAGSANDVISGLTEIYGRGNQAKQAVGDSYANRKMQYNQNYNNSLQTEAQYDRQNFQYNEIAPYEEAVTANNQLIQAGLGNITDGADMGSMFSAMQQGIGMPQGDVPYQMTDQQKKQKLYQDMFRQNAHESALNALRSINNK